MSSIFEPTSELRLGLSATPSWSSPSEMNEILEIARFASDRGASTFMFGDRYGVQQGVRSNAVIISWLLKELQSVARVGCLFLVRQTTRERLFPMLSTLAAVVSESDKIPLIGVLRGRETDLLAPSAPDLEDTVAFLRDDPDGAKCEVWIGAEHGSALDRAGRLSDVWLANATPPVSALAEKMNRVRRAAPGTPPRAALRRDVICESTTAGAQDTMRKLLADGYRNGRFVEDSFIVGDPAACVEQLTNFQAVGFSDLLLRPAIDGPEGLDQLGMLFDRWDEA